MLRRQIAVMSPEQFEQLVFELAHRDDPEVRRLVHPDGGADTLRPVTAERASEVWQAKRYPDSINWKECENSLDSLIERFKPSKVTFVFPRDLSQQLEGSFEERLVTRDSAQKATVQVGLWNLSELVRRLNQHPDLKVRFFGREQEDVLVRMERTMAAGGLLESGADLVERARTLTEYAEQRDVDFTYRITSGPREAPAPKWDELPYMTLAVGDERTEVQVATWVREGAEVSLPSLHFVDTEEGQRARLDAVKALARDEVAQVTEGVRLTLHPPEVMRDLAPDPPALGAGNTNPQSRRVRAARARGGNAGGAPQSSCRGRGRERGERATPCRFAGMRSARAAARRGPAHRGTGKSPHGRHASTDHRGSPGAAGWRFAPGSTTAPSAGPSAGRGAGRSTSSAGRRP